MAAPATRLTLGRRRCRSGTDRRGHPVRRVARFGLGLILVVYVALFANWARLDELGPSFCCHQGEVAVQGAQLAAS